MKQKLLSLLPCLLGLVLNALPPIGHAQTSVPAAMTYQGKLIDSNGVASPDGAGYEIEVRLWTSGTGGTTPIWAARYAGVPVKNGGFSLILGAPGGVAIGGAIADLKTVFNTASTTYLALTVTKNAIGATVASPSEILPRQQLLSSPYAFRSESAAVADTAATVGPNAVGSLGIQSGAITNSTLQDGSVNGPKIAGSSVTNSHIQQNTIKPDRMALDFAIFADQKPQGTRSGQAVLNTWQKRTLNTTIAAMGSSISLSNSTITLQPGSYFLEGDAPAYAIGRTCAAIRKSGVTPVIFGSSEYTQGSSAHSYYQISVRSVIRGVITVSNQAETFEVWQFTESNNGPDDLGVIANASGVPETYTSIKVTRIN